MKRHCRIARDILLGLIGGVVIVAFFLTVTMLLAVLAVYLFA
jgi:hypothetical protein